MQVERPVRLHFPLRDPLVSEGVERSADLVVSLHGDLQQEPLNCDFTSCLARQQCLGASFNGALGEASRLKVQKYHKYSIAPRSFYPLPFGRTNLQKSLSFARLLAAISRFIFMLNKSCLPFSVVLFTLAHAA